MREIFSQFVSVFSQSQLSDYVYYVLQEYRLKKTSIYQMIIIKNYQYLLFASSYSYCTNNILDIPFGDEGKKSIWPWVV